MVPISPAWREYYMELEPDRRRMLLEKNLREEEEDGAGECRRRLFSLRYLEEGKTEPSVDRYLWACVNFVQVYSATRLFKKGGRKEVEQFLEKSGYREAMTLGEAGQTALYWEIRNAAKRYFKTCMGTEYRRSLEAAEENISPVMVSQGIIQLASQFGIRCKVLVLKNP
jgi:hypothetical protein